MFNAKYERIIMTTIIVGIVGLLGFSEYYCFQDEKKEKPQETPVSKVESVELEPFKNIQISSKAHEDLEKMSKSAGRDHIELLLKKGYVFDGSEEEKSGLLITFGSKDAEKNQEIYDWLEKQAYKYGFVKRYESNRSIYRYTGREEAKTIVENGLSFETYLKN
ncbi:MAG: hypothetical protein KH135_05515 [Firmicutes bacterium]|nr:hypothetical protein [Bacillota bacterium]